MTNRKQRRANGHHRQHRLTCPDCAARVDATELRHTDSCPLSAALESVIDTDRDYFLTHPHARQRRRPPAMAEILHVNLAAGYSLPDPPAGHRWEPAGTVTVTLVGDGVRARDFSEMMVIAIPEQAGPA